VLGTTTNKQDKLHEITTAPLYQTTGNLTAHVSNTSSLLMPIERHICELYSSGLTSFLIAQELKVDVELVDFTLTKPLAVTFYKELINAQITMTKEFRLNILGKIIRDKISAHVANNGGDYSTITNKDIVDLLTIQDNYLKEREKAELGTNDKASVQLSLLTQILQPQQG